MDAAAFIAEHGLFEADEDNVVRLPMLVRGELVVPPRVRFTEVARALEAGGPYVELDDAQIVREEVLDRETLRFTGEHLYLVMPRLDDPVSLGIVDTDVLARELYSIPSRSAAEYIDRVAGQLAPAEALFGRVAELTRRSADTPDAYLNLALSNIGTALSGERLLETVDWEIAFGEAPGSRYLDGWVEVANPTSPGLTAALSATLHGGMPLAQRSGTFARALPTRQLHITAGNSPIIPVISAVRALATKGAAIVKIPSGALVAGCALGVACKFADPDHPLTRFTSVVYWQGGDQRVEGVLMDPRLVDRIVVWGAPGSVESVLTRSPLVKTISFNPRYGVSLIAEAALVDSFDETVRRAATDALVWNQKACIASLVQYVEGGEERASRFTQALASELARWDETYPNPLNSEALARVRTARRGGLASGRWYSNGPATAPTSAAVHMPGDFDLLSHPMSRVVVVRGVDRIEDVIPLLTHFVSQVGVAPEARRLAVRDAICARGVSCVLPLGEADTLFTGMPHDSMRPLSELVSWVVS